MLEPDSYLQIGSTNVVEVDALQDRVTGEYLEAATATVSLYDPTPTVVTGASALSCAHVTGTEGPAVRYRATIPHTVTLTEQTYTLTVTATDTLGVLTESHPIQAVTRPPV